jgi:predicted nucleic acid-binding protein
MTAKVFFDTNLWVYYYAKDPLDKVTVVSDLITAHRRSLLLSSQVLGEFYNVVTRKKIFTKPQAANILGSLVDTFPIQGIESSHVLQATIISDRYGYTYWDSLILATALLANCTIVYSEDMQHNQLVESQLRIVNPFV